MMNHNIIDYYIINFAIPSIITIETHYQIDFGNPVCVPVDDRSTSVLCGIRSRRQLKARLIKRDQCENSVWRLV